MTKLFFFNFMTLPISISSSENEQNLQSVLIHLLKLLMTPCIINGVASRIIWCFCLKWTKNNFNICPKEEHPSNSLFCVVFWVMTTCSLQVAFIFYRNILPSSSRGNDPSKRWKPPTTEVPNPCATARCCATEISTCATRILGFKVWSINF